MSEFKASGFGDEFGSSGPDIVGLTTFTSPYYFVPPSGSTAERPSSPPPGMLRFNTDIGRLEVWRNDHWATILGESPNLGDQNNTNSSGGTGTRGINATGTHSSPVNTNTIEYITIETLGNSQDFGDANIAHSEVLGGISSRTRGVYAGGYANPAHIDTIDFVTIASTGNANDFGNLIDGGHGGQGLSNQTRGIFCVGNNEPGFTATNRIDYITIASTGNAIDFGDRNTISSSGACASSTRGVIFSGNSPTAQVNTIQILTISTTGNAQDFADLPSIHSGGSAAGNATRALYMGGSAVSPAGDVNTIEFFTIATTGNAQDFGDLTQTPRSLNATSSSTRMVRLGGFIPGDTDTMDFATIATTGNAQDFGNLLSVSRGGGAFSNGHGGL